MSQRRRLDRETRRDEIVSAALRLFATREPGQVSMEELAGESSASPALIYHYFGNKHGLAVAALTVAADELVGRMQTRPEDPAAVQLVVGLDIYLDYLEAHPASWSALLTASAARDTELVELVRAVDDHAVALAVRALDSDPPPRILEVALRGWLEMVKTACLAWLHDGTPDRAGVQTLLAGAFDGCVRAAAAADPACLAAVTALDGPAHPAGG